MKKIHRFIGDFRFDADSFEIGDRDVVGHIARVLKMRPGEHVVLCDGKGNEAEAELIDVDPKSVRVLVLERRKSENEAEKRVILYCAMLKRENFELVVQKAVELGVKKIVPIISRRTIKLQTKHDRLQKIIEEASEQSGRGVLMEIAEVRNLSDALAELPDGSLNVFFDVEAPPIKEYESKLRNATEIGIFIGPEGGWDPEEIEEAKDAGLLPANLGRLVYRAETAAIVAAYHVLHL